MMSQVPSRSRWDPIHELQREMGRLIDSLDPFQSLRHFRHHPPINVYDTGDGYILCAQLPGLSPADIELTITGETLSMRGERKRLEGVKEDSYRRQERPFGRWTRTITLPDGVDGEKVTASFSNGVLTVILQKAEGSKPRHISVTSTS